MALKSYDHGTQPFPATYDVVKIHTLQMTNMGEGNNKFYNIELQRSGSQYRIYTSYGRTGAAYVKNEDRFPSEYNADSEYQSILSSKLKKGYREVKVATAKHASAVGQSQILSQDFAKPATVPSTTASAVTTDSRIIPLIERLYAEAGQGCQSQLHGSLKTSADNPLGTLTLGQIDAGKQVLNEVNAWLVANPHEVNKLHAKIISWTNDFYSAIPQQIPLRPKDPVGREQYLKQYCLNRPEILDEKYDLLDLLAKVDDMKIGFHSNDIDKKYEETNTVYAPATAQETEYAKTYMVNSQSKHHNWNLVPVRVWSVASRAQKNNLTYMQPIGNIQRLFHGTGAQNVLGICRKGFLLKPAGVYVSGKMFGEGTYFADQSTKSSQYATGRFGGYASHHGDTSFMFIVDVALGRIKEYENSQWNLVKPPAGFDSVKGVKGSSLLHNEFIVYSEKQNVITLLIEFKQTYR